MFNIGWPELVLIGAVALVAVGPKDLPRALHAVGVWVGKARRFMQSIQHDFDRMTYEAEEVERRKEQTENKTDKLSDDKEN